MEASASLKRAGNNAKRDIVAAVSRLF